MGGGGAETASPTVVPSTYGGGGAYCSSTSITKSTAITTDIHTHRPVLSKFSGGPFKPPPSSSGIGISCVCPVEPAEVYYENLDFSRKLPCSSCVFGAAPSRLEVETAMADLLRFMHGEARSNMHWLHPIVYPSDLGMLQSPGYARVRDAFGMLQREPTVQNMVINISSDKAVWDAIMSNRAIQNLQTSVAAEQRTQTSSEEAANIANLIVKWILEISKSKIVHLIEKIGMMAIELFLPSEKEKPTSELTDLVEEKIRSSLLLSVVILMIVVVTRNDGA